MEKQHVKEEVSKLMFIFSKQAEEFGHKIGDMAEELHHVLGNILKEEEQNPEHLSDGDLVVSPVELQFEDGTRIPAGHAFKFTENLSKEIKSPLYRPTIEQAMDFARREELREVELLIRKTIAFNKDLEYYHFYHHVVKRLTKDLNSHIIP